MGFALAREASRRGAIVTLIAGPTPLEPPPVAELVRVRSAREMHRAVLAASAEADLVVMAAAVADFAPRYGAVAAKIEKGPALTLELERTPDILGDLGARRAGARSPVLIGFAAQTGDPVPAASRKLAEKRVDFVVANDISAEGAGFDVETNEVTIVSATGAERLPLMTKDAAAAAVLDRAAPLLAAARPEAVPR